MSTPADNQPIYQPATRSSGSAAPSGELLPNEHLRLLIELMKPIGIETSRRWIAALMVVPEDQREALVDAIETQIIREFGGG